MLAHRVAGCGDRLAERIWPTSIDTFGCAFTASANARAADENFFGPSVP
jgi:hypothetical protein